MLRRRANVRFACAGNACWAPSAVWKVCERLRSARSGSVGCLGGVAPLADFAACSSSFSVSKHSSYSACSSKFVEPSTVCQVLSVVRVPARLLPCVGFAKVCLHDVNLECVWAAWPLLWCAHAGSGVNVLRSAGCVGRYGGLDMSGRGGRGCVSCCSRLWLEPCFSSAGLAFEPSALLAIAEALVFLREALVVVSV